LDYCEKCYALVKRAGIDVSKFKKYDEGECDTDDYKEYFEFPVDTVVSKGKFAFKIANVVRVVGKEDDKKEEKEEKEEKEPKKAPTYRIIITNDGLEFEEDEATVANFEEGDMKYICKALGVDELSDYTKSLEGKVFSTKEKYASHAAQELVLAGKFGVPRKHPTRAEMTEFIGKALASLEKPAVHEMYTKGELYRFFLSLFDLEVFDGDEVSALWQAELCDYVEKHSDHKVTVEEAKDEEFPQIHNEIREILLVAHSKGTNGKEEEGNGKRILVAITPASNGWLCFEKN